MRSLRLKEKDTDQRIVFETVPTLRGRTLVEDGTIVMYTGDDDGMKSQTVLQPRQTAALLRWLLRVVPDERT